MTRKVLRATIRSPSSGQSNEARAALDVHMEHMYVR